MNARIYVNILNIYHSFIVKQVYNTEFGSGHQILGPSRVGHFGIASYVAVLHEGRSVENITGS